jgi:uncharacterized protein YciI
MIAVICKDKPGSDAGATRMRLLAEHLAHVEAILPELLVAGPLRDDAGAICGSLLVWKTDSVETAKALMARDPYAGADIWASVEYRAFSGAAGDWVGGAAWKQPKA